MNSYTNIENLIDYSRDKLGQIRRNKNPLQVEEYDTLVSYIIGELDNTLNKMNQEGGGRRKTRKAKKSRRKH